MRLIENRLSKLELARRERGVYELRAAFETWADSELLSLMIPGWEDREPRTPAERSAYEKFRSMEDAFMAIVAGCRSKAEADDLIEASVARLVPYLQPRISRAVAAVRQRGEQVVKL